MLFVKNNKYDNEIYNFFPMNMLDKHITCINVLVQLFVSCLVSCVYWITQHYASHSDTVYTTDSTWYKQLHKHNMHIICILSIIILSILYINHLTCNGGQNVHF